MEIIEFCLLGPCWSATLIGDARDAPLKSLGILGNPCETNGLGLLNLATPSTSGLHESWGTLHYVMKARWQIWGRWRLTLFNGPGYL